MECHRRANGVANSNGHPVKTIGTLIGVLSKVNPQVRPSTPDSSVPIAPQSDETQPHQTQAQGQAQSNTASGACLKRGFSTLGDIAENPEPRAWALGILALYGEVTTVASPGGFGKTALAVGLALEAASGRDFLGHKVFHGEQNTLLISSEESETELRRRFKAALRDHQIIQAASDRVMIRGVDTESGSRIELMTLEGKGKVPTLNEKGLARLEWLLHDTGARIVILDPLNNFLAGGLNDNTAMGALVGELKQIAIKWCAAIILLHHTSKGADLETTDAIMGAAAIANFSRVAITLVRMTRDEARNYYRGVPPSQAHRYFRLNCGKLNYAMPADDDQWYWQRSINLGNDTPEYPNGDSVGVVERVDPTAICVSTSNAAFDRIALRTIAGAPANALLGMSKKGGSDRNVHDHVRRALRQSGAAVRPKDLYQIVDNLIDSLFVRGLVEEKSFTDRFRKNRAGLKLTETGHNLLNEKVE